MKKIGIIGATGSVGKAALDICRRFKDVFSVEALACSSNIEKLSTLCEEFKPKAVCVSNPKEPISTKKAALRTYEGESGLLDMVMAEDIDNWVFASSGTGAMAALRAAIMKNIDISIANKEIIVAGGQWLMPLVKRASQIRPIDSEHSAIWQCLKDESKEHVHKIYLTASGGPFVDFTKESLEGVTLAQAIKHPVWRMGPKITIDSATMANKGIECMEAARLFGLPMERIGAVVHRKSQIHGMVQFIDGTCKLLLSSADMRLPALAALSYPDRLPVDDKELNCPDIDAWDLQFSKISKEIFPAFYTACEAGKRGGAYPALFIGADEAAVEAFLKQKIKFTDIAAILDKVMSSWQGQSPKSLEEAIELIEEGRALAGRFI